MDSNAYGLIISENYTGKKMSILNLGKGEFCLITTYNKEDIRVLLFSIFRISSKDCLAFVVLKVDC